MILIAHRRNTIEQLIETPSEVGVEVDIRSQGDHLVIHHDPFVGDALHFEPWLSNYRNKALVLNVKEEGLEGRLLALMAKYAIEEFFFLDQSFPFLIRTSMYGERRCAVRVSEFEGVDTALRLAGKVDWVWVDCFTRFPLDKKDARRLRDANFRLCIVSPELQGRVEPSEISKMRELLLIEDIRPDAVCTKVPDKWR